MADAQVMTPGTVQAAIETAKEILQAMAIVRAETGTHPKKL